MNSGASLGVAGFRRCALLFMFAMVMGLQAQVQVQTQFAVRGLKNFADSTEPGMESRTALIQASDGFLYGSTLLGGGSLKGTLFRLGPDGTGYKVIRKFTATEPGEGASPYGALLEGSDRLLYGTTYEGGLTNRGIIFSVDKQGAGWRVLHRFAGGASDGANPFGGVVEGPDGVLYGTTFLGGTANLGLVFKINRDGTGFRVLKQFAADGSEGVQPAAPLLIGRDGVLYGTTYLGGASRVGTIFKINSDGSGFALLHAFTSAGGDGANPFGRLLEGADGSLYGTTTAGGAGDIGTVFRIGRDGSGYVVLHRFSSVGGSGNQPFAELVQGGGGLLYGTTAYGGVGDRGAVFQLGTNGTGFNILQRFAGGSDDGSGSFGGLCIGQGGVLFGATISGGSANMGAVYRMNPDGTGYQIIHHFAGTGGEAANPYAGVIQLKDGLILGSAFNGGRTNLGAIYKLNRDGSGYSVVHHFTGANGSLPHARLMEGRDGMIYGTTASGGTSNLGTVFKMGRDGSGFLTLRHFTGPPSDGMSPYGELMEGTDGWLYGTTAGEISSSVYGTIFRMQKDGSGYAVMHRFSGTGGGGNQPFAGLVEGDGGWLYGTTAYTDVTGPGTLFRIHSSGIGFAVMHSFVNPEQEGRFPFARIIRGRDGLLYGTLFSGGIGERGAVFRMALDGSGFQIIRRFSGEFDGAQPSANSSLVEGADGYLYGVTFQGGRHNLGTIYRLKPDGADYSVVFDFTASGGAGGNPYGGLFKAQDGSLLGTTQNGGAGNGTVFRLTPEALLSISPEGRPTIQGPAGFKFAVQSSSEAGNPESWQNMGILSLTGAPVPIVDPSGGAAGAGIRFYRAMLQPQ